MARGKKYFHLLQGKDVVILIGNTGAGKSLSINYLMGKYS